MAARGGRGGKPMNLGGAAAAVQARSAAQSARGGAAVRGKRRPIQTIKLKTLKRPQASDIISVFNNRTESLSDKKSLAEDFGLQPLLELASHDHISIKGYGEKILYDMKQEEGEIFVEDFSPIAEALRVKNMAAQVDGIWTLAVFAGLSDKNHPGILLDVGWPAILARAKAAQPQLKLGSVTLIANLSTSEDSQDMIMKEGGIELLRELLEEIKTNPDISLPLKRAVLNAFANLTAVDQWRKDIVDSNFLDIISQALHDADEETKAAATHIIANITEKEEYRRECAERGMVTSLLPMLRSPNEIILSGVTKFYAQVVETPEFAEQAVDAGLPDWLARLASRCDNSEVLLNVIRTTDILAELGFGDDLKGVDLDKFLRRLMESSEDEEVRNAARQALETMGAPNLPPRPRTAGGGVGKGGATAFTSQQDEWLKAEAEEAARKEEEARRERQLREEQEMLEREAEEIRLREEAEEKERQRMERERLERERVNNTPVRKKPPVDREALMRAEQEALEKARREHEARIKGQFISGK